MTRAPKENCGNLRWYGCPYIQNNLMSQPCLTKFSSSSMHTLMAPSIFFLGDAREPTFVLRLFIKLKGLMFDILLSIDLRFWFHFKQLFMSSRLYQPTWRRMFSRSISVSVFSTRFSQASCRIGMASAGISRYASTEIDTGHGVGMSQGSLQNPAFWYSRASFKWLPFFHISWAHSGTCSLSPFFFWQRRRSLAFNALRAFLSLDVWYWVWGST